jgi:transcriptional regulator with XRE-family HTH domain
MGKSRVAPLAVAEFGARVRRQRQALGWSLETLGERSGLHWTYIGSIERGRRNPGLINILRLAAALRVDPAELVTELKP